MLRSFRVANHRSLRDEHQLLLMPQYQGERTALPVTAIFGANASGKSNLLDALRFVQSAVRDSYQRWSPTGRIPRQPYRLDEQKKHEASWYVIEVLIEGVKWTYGFELDDNRVLEEWLFSYPQHRRRVIFERDSQGIRFGSTVANRRDRSRVLKDLTRDNALLLSLAAQTGVDEVLPMFSWLDRGLHLVTNDEIFHPEMLADFLIANPERQEDVRTLVLAADLGVTELQVRSASDDRPGEAPQSRLRLAHGDGGAFFELADESAGTRSWLGLMPLVLEALINGDTLIVDELDTSLHPRLVARVVELFRSPETNTGGGQLVFTTHDATLLGTSFGEELLKRDEIWFVDKGRDGASSLFPLSDFHPRKGENAERRYLGGSYGAVPAVFSDTLVGRLLRARERTDAAS
jgi:uncharacterized protein